MYETESIVFAHDGEDCERFAVVSVPLGPGEHFDDVGIPDLELARRPTRGCTAVPELDAVLRRPDLPPLITRVNTPRLQVRHAHMVARVPIGSYVRNGLPFSSRCSRQRR
jgi:hypothetical protein